MSETLSYQSIRSANQAREADEQKQESRKKNLLILILHYLNGEGYVESANSLGRETNIDLGRFEVCDNVDLDTVLMEYESYYFIKFSRYPKITKKLMPQGGDGKSKQMAKLKRSTSLNSPRPSGLQAAKWGTMASGTSKKGGSKESRSSSTPSLPRLPPQGKPTSPTANANGARPRSSKYRERKEVQKQVNGASNHQISPVDNTEPLALHGLVVHGNHNSQGSGESNPAPQQKPKVGQIIDIRSMINDATRLNTEEGYDGPDRLLKPLGGYVGYNSEWRELAQVISRDIYSQDPNVRWDDIIGLETAKRLVKEAVVYPIKYPQLFKGILSPWKGLLLYGPPGTGKTLLAKAVATECNTTFFNISASSIVSKWRGDSEKLVRVLFELARFHAPSTIFLDELESLMSQRGSQGGTSEHEGSRRMKTELLVQMDGLAKTDDLVFLLAASNLPWELDHAMLRRLEKRIIVDLPTTAARRAMFTSHLPPIVNAHIDNGLELRSDLDYDQLAKKTEGYSGSDIRLVCKEAAMRPVRKIFSALENHTDGGNLTDAKSLVEIIVGTHGEELHLDLDMITTTDVEIALRHTKPSAMGLKPKYLEWQKHFESV